ncbi:hypothetical protein A2U01_0099333, partial [Trifolium medium]|nr:hypothetical protein [Trifolium medium]
ACVGSEMEVMMCVVVVTDLRWGGGGCDGFVMGVVVAAARSELEVMRGVVVRC